MSTVNVTIRGATGAYHLNANGPKGPELVEFAVAAFREALTDAFRYAGPPVRIETEVRVHDG